MKERERMMAVKREIRLIALDMDGTLLNHNQEITEENKKAIKRAKESDIQIVISTGRPFQQIERYMDELNLSSFSVTINGSEIWEGRGKLIEQHLFRQEQIERLWKLANIHNLTYWAITEGEIFHNNIPHHVDLSKYKWLKFGFDIHDTNLRNMIIEELRKDDLEVTNSSPTNLEINPLGINKGAALEKVCDRLGFTIDHVMAVGDSLNDISMIKKAGFGVAMGNAQDTVKNAADWTTATNEENGVAKAIYEVLGSC